MEFKTSFIKLNQLIVFFLLVFLVSSCAKNPESKRVILIGIDGMGMQGLQQANTPNLDLIIQSGALSLKTRGVMPTVSGPNWSSHLLGAGPEQHGITSNDWTVDNHSIYPTQEDEDGYFPSLFNLIHHQKTDAETALFYDWDALANFYNVKIIDKVEFSKDYHETLDKSGIWIIENNPLFSFVYIGHPDEIGHEYGWGSKEYLQALEDVDKSLGKFFDQLKGAGMFENTHILIVTDHGGNEHGHGGLSMEEIEIPWMIAGPGVIENRLIEQPNSVVNTASTICWLLGLNQPESWTGRPVYGAFSFSSESGGNKNSYVPQPISSLESGIYFRSETASFNSPWPNCQIRFNRDGNDPTIDDPVYKSPILLDRSLIIKAACFKDNKRSRITTLHFTKSILVKGIKVNVEPSEKYLGQGNFGLINRETASADFHDVEWLGFEGVSPAIDLDFSELKSTRSIRIGYLDSPNSWIFPPLEIRIEASVDGNKFVPIKTMTSEEIIQKTKSGRNWASIYFDPIKAQVIRIFIKSQGQCPQGHPGEGKSAWLFLDEVVVE